MNKRNYETTGRRVKRLTKWRAVALVLFNITAVLALSIGAATATVELLDQHGDDKCAAGDWHGADLCPPERARGRW